MNPLLAIQSPIVEKKRTFQQAFGGNIPFPGSRSKRTKIVNTRGCEVPSPTNSKVLDKESDLELIDLCSESSGSYKTASDGLSPTKGCNDLKFQSEISIGSSLQSANPIDLSMKKPPTKRVKRFTTITLTSDEEGTEATVHKILTTKSSKSPRKRRDNLSLNLQVICLLGTGGYGKVFLVRTKENLEYYSENDGGKKSDSSVESGIVCESPRKGRRGKGRDVIQYVRNTAANSWALEPKSSDSLNYYALKVIKKSNVLKSATDLRHLKMEQRILSRVQHPFIVECYLAAQTEKQLFFISEYIQGGELFNLLDRFAPLDESDSAFYMAEILVALEYLHSLGIIYRDLKPENIMLTSEGHIKMVDFGLSRDDFPGGPTEIVTATKCGTKEYMAPEVFRKQQYGYAADWWSFGAVSFDLMTNKVPINDQEYDKAISFPKDMSRTAKDLLKRLMTVDHKCRLGSVHGATAIARHPFFHGINWPDVEEKKLRPPFRLNRLPDPGDFSCFSRKVTSNKRRRVCSESKKSFVDPQLQHHFDNFDFVHSCDLNQKLTSARK